MQTRVVLVLVAWERLDQCTLRENVGIEVCMSIAIVRNQGTRVSLHQRKIMNGKGSFTVVARNKNVSCIQLTYKDWPFGYAWHVIRSVKTVPNLWRTRKK